MKAVIQISLIFLLVPLTIFSQNIKEQLSPVRFEHLRLNVSDQNISKIQLIDSKGKVVYTDNVVSQNETIDLSEIMSGLYIVQIHTSDYIYTTKIMIK